MKLNCGAIGAAFAVLLIAGDAHAFAGQLNYRFDGKISREVLDESKR